ncbi:hypothetical protein P3T39_003542 [Kitasatospora sp. GP82]|nr:hypothetical protein [Kitasatospora sp. GP82]
MLTRDTDSQPCRARRVIPVATVAATTRPAARTPFAPAKVQVSVAAAAIGRTSWAAPA